ncbi:hypothetical protein F3Y22_tig00109987pilonHSYRG00256 [Hibiscus syriacus]|uniref:WDR11 TPR domain-containing protein n=1 Tax=Hibiscus syriacus TaxID=106335 RepID=A0A6A3BR63_HIBSY|nr:hypothetical protein F3Y22_tig00109987pilonHSYRG00256 [Hibiscus syriacus]
MRSSLVGQLQALSSTVTMLAVPSPSLAATLSIALGSQSGTIDVIDVSANAVAASFEVHNITYNIYIVLLWTQVNEKTAGYINKLVVTCLRSGLNRTLRVLQKPESAPIRALRTSSSGRHVSGWQTQGQLSLMAFEQEDLWERANECIPWHGKLEGEEAIQNRVHELVTVGNFEGAVSLLLSASPESPYFYPNALRAVALSSAVSRSLLQLALKVVAANVVRTDRSLSGTHLPCAVGSMSLADGYFNLMRLQDSGCWTDAATLAAAHLKGSDYARFLFFLPRLSGRTWSYKGGQSMSIMLNTTFGGTMVLILLLILGIQCLIVTLKLKMRFGAGLLSYLLHPGDPGGIGSPP